MISFNNVYGLEKVCEYCSKLKLTANIQRLMLQKVSQFSQILK